KLPDLTLVTIDDPICGGWAKAQPYHFGDGGTFDQLYKPAQSSGNREQSVISNTEEGTNQRMSSLPARARAGSHFRKPSVIPGFGLTFGFSVAYLTLLILIPLAALVLRSTEAGFLGFWRLVTDERTLKALETSFGTAFIAALVNVVFGVILAWVLVRYRFPGRRFVDAIVDIPFA